MKCGAIRGIVKSREAALPEEPKHAGFAQVPFRQSVSVDSVGELTRRNRFNEDGLQWLFGSNSDMKMQRLNQVNL